MPRPIGFAHRGGRAERPENTLEAFERALELGATGLETDAWITADGVVVLDHDGVTGPIFRRQAVATKKRSDLPGHIPSLEDLYRRCGTDYELSIDIKDPGALEPLVAVADDAGAASRLWLCHHDWRVLAGWRRLAGSAHLVESTRLAWIPEGLDPRSRALADAGIEALNLHCREWDPVRVAEVHVEGIRAFGWDAQTEADIARLISMGIDAIYSDYVGRLMSTIRAVGIEERSERPDA